LQEADALSAKGLHLEADKLYQGLIKTDGKNIDLHYKYIRNFFNSHILKKDTQRLFHFYDSLKINHDISIQDNVLYALGLAYSFLNEYDRSIKELNKVHNQNLKYVNNSLGWCYMRLGNFKKAEEHLKREIANKGNTEGAYQNLTVVYQKTRQELKLEKLINDPNAANYISVKVKKEFYFRNGKLLNYFTTIFFSMVSSTNRYGLLGALCILLIWTIYLRKLDLYESEKWTTTMLTVFLGMFFAQFTFLLNDFNELILKNTLTGGFWNDFIYCFLGIGAVEEFVKIIPLLIILLFTKEINEPIDYLKYASLSAVGFAFSENLVYFQTDVLHIIPSRALICVTGHMFYSAVIAYGIMLAKYRKHRYPFLTYIIAFTIASFFHGFYDFWLINQKVHVFSKLSLVFFVFSTTAWIVLINNCLNNSPFYDEKKVINVTKFRDYLFAALIAIFIITFILITIKEGPRQGNKALLQETLIGLIILPIVVRNMSNIKILRNYWSFHSYPHLFIKYEHIIGNEIRISIPNPDITWTTTAELKGKIVSRKVISNDPNCFLVELRNDLGTQNLNSSYVYLLPKGKWSDKKLSKLFKSHILIPSLNHPKKEKLEKGHMQFGGQVYVEILKK